MLGLKSIKVNAEIPQAIVYYNDGRRAVVTEGIRSSFSSENVIDVLASALNRARSAGFKTSDTNARNVISNHRGVHVIDVNCWEHPAVKRYLKKMINAIRIEAENREIATQGIV